MSAALGASRMAPPTYRTVEPRPPLYAAALRAAVGACAAGARTLWLWRERAHQRRQLLELDDRLLRDIGLTPGQVREEYRKPFWRP